MFKRTISLLFLFSLLWTGSASAETTVAMISTDTLLYGSQDEAMNISSLPRGTIVTVHERGETHTRVLANAQEGFIRNDALIAPVSRYVSRDTYTVDADGNRVAFLPYNETVRVFDLEDASPLLRLIDSSFIARDSLSMTPTEPVRETRYVTKDVTVFATPQADEAIATLKAGQMIQVTGQIDGYYRTDNGYVAVATTSANPVKTGQRYVQTDTTLYADTTRSRVVGSLKRGQSLSIYGTDGAFTRVSLNGTYVFVESKALGAKAPAPLKTGMRYILKNTPVYATASSATKVAQLKRGQYVNIYGTVGSYTRVYVNGTFSFVPTNVTGTTKPPLFDSTGKRYVKFNSVSVYASASTASRVTRLKRGQIVETFGTSGYYTRVRVGGQYRFMATGYLSFNKPVAKPKAGTVFYVQLDNTPYFSTDVAYARPAGTLKRGTRLVGIRSIDDDFWYVRLSSGKKVYVINPYIAQTKPKAVQQTKVNPLAQYMTTKQTPFYANPSDTRPIGYLDANRRVYPRSKSGDSYLIQYNWRPVYVKKTDIRAKADPLLKQRSNARTERLIAAAARHLGTPYTWGSQSPTNGGFDCSGLIHYAANQAGKVGGRTNVAGYWSSGHFKNKRTAFTSGRRGDIIFFAGTYRKGPSHIGIMLDNEFFIHAGGETLQINSIYDSQWRSYFLGYKSL